MITITTTAVHQSKTHVYHRSSLHLTGVLGVDWKHLSRHLNCECFAFKLWHVRMINICFPHQRCCDGRWTSYFIWQCTGDVLKLSDIIYIQTCHPGVKNVTGNAWEENNWRLTCKQGTQAEQTRRTHLTTLQVYWAQLDPRLKCGGHQILRHFCKFYVSPASLIPPANIPAGICSLFV